MLLWLPFLFLLYSGCADASITRSQLDNAKSVCSTQCKPPPLADSQCIKKCWKAYFEGKHTTIAITGGGGLPVKRTSNANAVVAAWSSTLLLLGLVLVYN